MLKKLLPISIAGDEKFQAIADACDAELEKVYENAEIPAILSRIDQLPEPVLDLLAWQFHIEGWELASSIDEKRALIKSAIELHRYKGTKWAIKKVLEVLNLSGDIKEWFEYGGEPYCFRITTDISERKYVDTPKLLELINSYKNVRSWVEALIVTLAAAGKVDAAVASAVARPELEHTPTFSADGTTLFFPCAIIKPKLCGGIQFSASIITNFEVGGTIWLNL